MWPNNCSSGNSAPAMRGILTPRPTSSAGAPTPESIEGRASGVLLHPTSLPGPFGYGDSPYQSFSAFAGNPLLISLDELIAEGWLSETAVRRAAPSSTGS